MHSLAFLWHRIVRIVVRTGGQIDIAHNSTYAFICRLVTAIYYYYYNDEYFSFFRRQYNSLESLNLSRHVTVSCGQIIPHSIIAHRWIIY